MNDLLNNDKPNRAKGALLGLAIGDSVGMAVEFSPKDSFLPLTDMVAGGVFGLQKGQWTDDTSMALCLADSLIACNGFDPKDQMTRYLRWYQDGENSVTGNCFDIGMTTANALRRFQFTGNTYAGSTDPNSSGNGSLMRLAPVPIFYHDDLQETITHSVLSSKTTHGSADCLSTCAYFGEILWRALNGEMDKDRLLTPTSGYLFSSNVQAVIDGSFKKSRADIFGTGYVVRSLEASLWAFYHTDNFRDAVLWAVNLGDDADTTGAIVGQIAGAYYGFSGIPNEWGRDVAWRERILQLANELIR